MMQDKEKYQQAILMRRKGLSYSEISKSLNVAKGTLSYWFSKQKWSVLVTKKLNDRWGDIAKNRILAMNDQKKKQKERRYELIKKKAGEEFDQLVKDPLFLVGLSLYWGEGDKVQNGRVAVINSDERLLRIILKFYRSVLRVCEEKIRVGMFIYFDHDEEQVKKYWSEKLEVSSDQFIKTQILPSRSNLTKRKATYGMCSVYFSSTELSIKIQEWIRILSSYKICGNSSVG